MRGTIQRSTALVSVLLLAFVQVGCGTIFGGSSQEVSLGSSPQGATVDIHPANRSVATPATVELKRGDNYEVTFSREGYEDATATIQSNLRAGILILDILFTGALGIAIDAGTGAWNSLSPENVSVELEKTDQAMAGPETIHVGIETGEDGQVEVRAERPIEVRVQRIDE